MSAQPGWYPDPEDSAAEIYFDGSSWTGEKRVRGEGLEVQPSEKSYSFSIPVPSKYLKKNRIIAALAIVAITITGVTLVNIQLDNKAKKEAAIERAEQERVELEARLALERIKNDITWVPSGYTPWRDDKSIAYKFIKNVGNDCYSCIYWTVEVVSKLGCSGGVYGELNIERNGTVIDYTNDSLSYLAPLQKGRLSFETYKDGSFQGRVTELNCR